MSSGGSRDRVDIRPLKKWARKNLPDHSKLKQLFLLEDDCLLPGAFLAKLPIWMNLYDIESNQKNV